MSETVPVLVQEAAPGVQVRCLVCGGGSKALGPVKFRVYGHGKPWPPGVSASPEGFLSTARLGRRLGLRDVQSPTR